MTNDAFIKKLESLYKENNTNTIIYQETKQLEEGILRTVGGLLGLSDNTSYKSAINALTNAKMEEVKLIRNMVTNLSKIESILTKLPSMTTDSPSKKALQEKLNPQLDAIRSRIERLKSDMEQIKQEAKETNLSITRSLAQKQNKELSNVQTPEDQTFKEWIE